MSKITLGKCLLSYIACAVIFSYFLQTSRGEFDSSEFEVRRRYQDFLWLKEKLEEAHPTLIIPVRLLFFFFFFNIIYAIFSCESLECLNTQFQTFDSMQFIYLGNICF